MTFTRIIMANSFDIETFLDSVNLKDEYLQHFKDTGYDDIELVKSLTDEEKQEMFTLVGLSTKPGHLLKFRKALAALHVQQIQDDQKPSTGSCGRIQHTKVQKSKCTSAFW